MFFLSGSVYKQKTLLYHVPGTELQTVMLDRVLRGVPGENSFIKNRTGNAGNT